MMEESDKRTKKILELFGLDYWNREDNDTIFSNLKHEDIMDFQAEELDVYRLFSCFSNLYSNINRDSEEMESNQSLDIATHFKEEKLLEKTKLWRLENSVKYFLKDRLKSIKIKEELILPFNDYFIDNIIDINENVRIFGMYIMEIPKLDYISMIKKSEVTEEIINIAKKMQIAYDRNVGDDKCCAIYCLRYGKGFGFNFVKKGYNLTKGCELEYTYSSEQAVKESSMPLMKQERKLVIDFITNLFLFLNEPRTVIHIDDKKNNERRERKGLIPIPSKLRTILDINLKNYIEKVYFDGQSNSKLGYSFWVRKHKRRLLSERYKEKQGEVIVIPSHIRGEGLMPPQEFIIKK